MRLSWLRLLSIIGCFWQSVAADGHCGSLSNFPARFAVDSTGRLTLSCAETSCFGNNVMKRCPIKFVRQPCTHPTKLTLEVVRQNESVVLYRCCEFPFLQSNTPVIVQATIRNGKQYNGGEILTNGKATHFNLVKEIEMVTTEEGGIEFLVTANQLPCAFPNVVAMEPIEDRKPVPLRIVQFQAPTADVDQPLPLTVDELEPLQPPPGSAAPLPPPTSTPTSSSPSPFAFYPLTLMPLLPFSLPPSPLRPGCARPIALQAPTYQPSGSTDTAAEQQRAQQWYQTWNDHYARNPTYPVPCQEEGMMQTLQCFSGDVLVQTPNGAKLMKHLEVGDLVLVHDGEQMIYEPVFAWLHRLDEQLAVFYRITTAMGRVLELTALHAIYESTDCRSINRKLSYAKDIKAGTCLVVKNGYEFTHAKVANVTVIQKRGIYAPLTPSGTIIANELLVSCYSDLLLPTVHQSLYKMMRYVAYLWYWISGGNVNSTTHAHDLPAAVAFMASTIQGVFPASLI